jgi:hypothetical protein
MATNLSIDPALIDEALEVSGERTKKAAVTKALREFVSSSRNSFKVSPVRERASGSWSPSRRCPSYFLITVTTSKPWNCGTGVTAWGFRPARSTPFWHNFASGMT